MNPYLLALLACVAAAVVEGLCAGKDPMRKLAQLQQPIWSPPTWAWVLIGVSWYAICFLGLVRLLPHYDTDPLTVRLLGVLMLANALANVPLFRIGRLDWAFLYLLPYWALLVAFLVVAAPVDRLTAILFLVYAAYQPYAAAWGWQLWALNDTFAPWLGKS